LNPKFASLLDAGTAVIADVFDSFGRAPLVLDTNLFAVKGPGTRFIGPAYTVSGESQRWSGGGDRAKLGAIDAMPPGVVPVWAGNDIRGVCCFGDLLATAMLARGCAGVVVDGGVRDLAFLRGIEMPVVARYLASAQAIGRWKVTASQIPVRVRGALEDLVTVVPGDIVVADDDGVIIVPADDLDHVHGRVVAWAQTESGARADIRSGLPLLTALEKYGHL
jgi:regulator of RNase E activity RraA